MANSDTSDPAFIAPHKSDPPLICAPSYHGVTEAASDMHCTLHSSPRLVWMGSAAAQVLRLRIKGEIAMSETETQQVEQLHTDQQTGHVIAALGPCGVKVGWHGRLELGFPFGKALLACMFRLAPLLLPT